MHWIECLKKDTHDRLAVIRITSSFLEKNHLTNDTPRIRCTVT